MPDLRIPIGLFFAITGILVVLTSFTNHAQAALSSANVDLYGGLAMLVFGTVMLWLARRTS